MRLAPQTLGVRFAAWARSQRALEGAKLAYRILSGSVEVVDIHPHSQGFAIAGGVASDRALRSEAGTPLSSAAQLALDAAGIAGVSLLYRQRAPEDWCDPITLEAFAARFLEPAIGAAGQILEQGSILGKGDREHLDARDDRPIADRGRRQDRWADGAGRI